MYIEQCLKDKSNFQETLNSILKNQSVNLLIHNVEVEQINNHSWVKVEYLNKEFSTVKHFWINDFKVFCNDSSINITQLHKDIISQIYLSNLNNARKYISDYKKHESSPAPEWLKDHTSISKQTPTKYNPSVFNGINPEDLTSKFLYHKFLSAQSTLTDQEKVDYISKHKHALECALRNVATLYEIEYSTKDIQETIEATLLKSQQNILNQTLSDILKKKNSKYLLDSVKNIIYLEEKIETTLQQKKQAENLFLETNGFNEEVLRQQLKKFCLGNKKLMQDEFYRTIIENTIILEGIKLKVQNLQSEKSLKLFWKKSKTETAESLNSDAESSSYQFPLYGYVSMISESISEDSDKSKCIQNIYTEFLTEQNKIFSENAKSLEDINYCLDINYRILAEAIKKQPCKNCSKIQLISDALIKSHSLSKEKIIEKYKENQLSLETELNMYKLNYNSKLEQLSPEGERLKKVLLQKNKVDSNLNEISIWKEKQTIDALVKLDLKDIDEKEVEKNLLEKNLKISNM